MDEISSFKAFLVTFTSSSLVSMLNKQQFITETREFTASFFVLSLYCLYVWSFEFLLKGRRVNNYYRIPSIVECAGLLTNLAWCYVVAQWFYMLIAEELVFTHQRLGACVIFCAYGVYITLQHSPVDGAVARCWAIFLHIARNPLRALVEKVEEVVRKEEEVAAAAAIVL